MTMLVEALVQAVTAQVVSAIAQEAQFAFKFKDELEQMKTWLVTMECLVVDADKKLMKQRRDEETVKKYLSKLREVIYEADNALTDYLIREEEKKKKRFFSCLLPLDPVFPHEMGRRLTKINYEMKDVHEELAKYLSATATADSSMSQQISSSRPFVSSLSPNKTYGLDGDIEKLKGWILGGDKSIGMNYIAIVGMAGLGKTTLAQQLFNDSQILGHLDKTMWVRVSRNFSEPWIMKKLLAKLDRGTSPSDSYEMLVKLIKALKGKSYLIVLDDVWPCKKNPDWLKNLCYKLPTSVGKSSWIIITTRNEDVAKNMVLRNTPIHKPKPLNNDDSWKLFSEYAFRMSKGECPNEQLKLDSKHILKKCGGLPMAIKTLGSTLSHKVDSPSEWKDLSNKFHALTTEAKTVDIIASLQLSYDELPHASLKLCLLSVSIYPEDFVIDAEQLIHWWVGEGLIQGKGSKTAIELGYEYLAELVNRCLLEAVDRRGYDGRFYKYKIHSMVREVIIKIAAEEAVCIFNEQGQLMQKHEQNEQKPRWFCISEDMDDDKKELEYNPKLRTFFLMSSPPNNFGKNFGFLESLRVLDLSYSKVAEDSSTSSPVTCAEDLFSYISSLKRLACLNLSGTQIREVPSSIQKLLNLQLLVLNGCKNLVKIHPSIKCLKRLIVLDVGDCPFDCLPKGLGSLCLLQELTGFKVVNPAKTQGCALRELSKLKKLRVLRIVLSDDTEISQDEMGILSSLSNLKVLSIDAEECQEQETLGKLDGLKMPPNLRELYVRNYHSNTMPNWFHPDVLSRLQYLCVENCDIKKLTSDQSTWTHVEGLCLKLLNYEEDGENLRKIMPALRYMQISHCSKFKNIPCEVEEQGVWRRQN